jgi:transcriptional regulator with XRE-family HTH domain
LIAEEMTLRELRRARKLTQVKMAKTLGVTQDSVSRLEKRSDLLLSTLRKTVAAMGGNLSLVAQFPDRAPVVLAGIAEDQSDPIPSERRRVWGRSERLQAIKSAQPTRQLRGEQTPAARRRRTGWDLAFARASAVRS